MALPDPLDESKIPVRRRNARLLRRLVLAPTPELVESFDDATPAELVDDVLAQPVPDVDVPVLAPDDGSYWDATTWWVETMMSPQAGIHERLVWFWHGHLTSSIDKASPGEMLDQHRLLRTGARGNFREMLRSITLDPAMLWWLDGAGSDVFAPNENFARELMELFTLGRRSGAYTEADVQAAAKALAGWWIDDDIEGPDRVKFEPEAALRRRVPLLGRQVRDVDDVIDAVCDHDACARHIAGRVHEHFVGGPLDPERHEKFAATFREANLEIEPLVHAVLHDESFLNGPPPRPRSALEWYLALRRLMALELEIWPLEDLGQAPMNPPNVAGWPGTERWESTGVLLTKGQIAINHAYDTEILEGERPVTDVLRRAVLYDVSPTTRDALENLSVAVDGREQRSMLLHAAVAMSPEFSTI